MALALSKSNWSRLFLAAALFNYVIGFPILLLRRWSFDLSYVETVGRDPMALRLWADFGFAVVLIGYGYQIIARDVDRNRGIVTLGILAKLFDVINLSTLFAWGVARPVVLIPAAIDGLFVIAFIAFLRSWPALPTKK
jgi:hypothetical protein